MKSLRVTGLLTVLILLFFSYACQKENNFNGNVPEGQQRINIRLSDNPVNFDAVNVDLQRVEVLVFPDSCRNRSGDQENQDETCHHDHDGDREDHDDCAVWDTLAIRPGIYNLLALSNGADTLLASGITVAGKIKKIRLTLGTSNTVIVDSISYPLTLLNGNNRVTINVRAEHIETLTPGDVQVWLDFDAGMSIVRVTNNHFVLKPLLRLWLPSQTASIKGKVIPLNAAAVVAAISNGDTLIAMPDHHDGRFKIRGLRGSTAAIFINATANGYRDTTITGITLQRGRDTDIGTIQLHN